MTTTDPRVLIRSGPMTRFQIVVVALCVAIAALDGFDVLVIAYTAPSIAREWRLGPTELGAVFSAGLIGMGLGGVLLGAAGDRFGRRPMALLSLLIVTLGMSATAYARDLGDLAALRAFTGLGIGGALVSINVIVSEYSSDRRRNLAISLMTVGYPVGATLGGFAAIYLIAQYGWRSVYLFGGAVGLALIPPVLYLLPESIEFLVARGGGGALRKANRILSRMNEPALSVFPETANEKIARGGLADIFRSQHVLALAATSCVYFFTSFTCYFLLSWMPKLLVERGLSLSGSISSSLLMNLAGAVGCVMFGVFAHQLGPRKFAAGLMVGLFAVTSLFGAMGDSAPLLIAVTIAIGFCLFASITALYAIVPGAFPVSIRSTGIGFAMSIGRIGAVMGPFAAGIVFAQGVSSLTYCAMLAAPMLVSAVVLYWVRACVSSATVRSELHRLEAKVAETLVR
jgi:benzoate transport